MTLEELKTVSHIRKEIDLIEQSIAELDSLLLPARQGGARSTQPSSPVESHLRKKLTLEARLRRKQGELLDALENVLDWLDTVDDGNIRSIVTARYILKKSWKETAAMCYEGITDKSVPYNALKNYLKRAD